MARAAVLGALARIAPLALAEPWDNVGVLVEPTVPRSLRRVFLTIDLTEPVMQEAIQWHADLVVAYHPPIFTPFKRLTQADPKQRILIQALEHGIMVYSPHTAADAAHGGVNDWLLEGLGPGLKTKPIVPSPEAPTGCLVTVTSESKVKELMDLLEPIGTLTVRQQSRWPESDGKDVVIECVGSLPRLTEALSKVHLIDVNAVLHQCSPPATSSSTTGSGRIVTLPAPRPLAQLVAQVKAHLGLPAVRVAAPVNNPEVRSVAVCAGSGADWLTTCDADVLWTGEMRHHDVLACVAKDKCVILCDHTNTERGWLQVLAGRLQTECPDIETACSSLDADPLQIR